MDILITHGSMARSRSMHLRAGHIVAVVSLVVLSLVGLTGMGYYYLFTKAAREGWPMVSQFVGIVVRDEVEQRDRFMRENLDAMARKVGEMQAKLVRLESIGERVSGMAGLKAEDLRAVDGPAPAAVPAKGGKAADAGARQGAATGAATVPAAKAARAGDAGAADAGGGRGGPFHPTSLDELNQLLATLDAQADHNSDVFTLVESRLLERRLTALVVPSIAPVDGPVGSGFGFRIDPFNGRPALHTGLDYPAHSGTPIHAAAGGVVRAAEAEAAYGMAVEIDHGNGLMTRYAHTSKVLVKPGDLVKRGQPIALVGNTGRSTGPHLHFEVLIDGVPQNPQRFLTRNDKLVDGREGATGDPRGSRARRSVARAGRPAPAEAAPSTEAPAEDGHTH